MKQGWLAKVASDDEMRGTCARGLLDRFKRETVFLALEQEDPSMRVLGGAGRGARRVLASDATRARNSL